MKSQNQKLTQLKFTKQTQIYIFKLRSDIQGRYLGHLWSFNLWWKLRMAGNHLHHSEAALNAVITGITELTSKIISSHQE